MSDRPATWWAVTLREQAGVAEKTVHVEAANVSEVRRAAAEAGWYLINVERADSGA